MSYILSYGFCLPHFQIEEKILSPRFGKKGKRIQAYVDEDIITLSFEAAQICLDKFADKNNIDAVFFATTSHVFTKRYHASFIADLLNLPKEITALDFGVTARAGTDALLLANQLVDAGVHSNILVITADVNYPGIGDESRKAFGHAACAILIGKNNGNIEIKSAKSYSCAIAEEFNYKNEKITLDPRYAREAGFKNNIKSVLEKLNLNTAAYDAVILNSLYAKLAGGIFFKSGFTETQFAKDNISFDTGNTGVCHAILQLYDCIESAKRKILLFDYYNGTNVFEIVVSDESNQNELMEDLKDKKVIATYQDYLLLRKAGNFDSIKYKPTEMFSSEMMNEREKENAIYLNGFECNDCNTVYFIKSARCKQCKCENFTLKKLERTGTIYALTKEFYFPASFAPITMAVIDLDAGGRVTVQMTDDIYADDKDKFKIGSKVKLVLRKMIERGAKPDYFWKGVVNL